MSLRAGSAVVGQLLPLLTPFPKAPAASTVESWLLRIGLYQLRRPLPQADDWILIMDHTMQLGASKCLIIVAIRQSVWQSLGRAVQLQDLTLVDLRPVIRSDGDRVFEQLNEAVKRVGSVRAILSDQGCDLVNGAKKFQQTSPQTLVLGDIAHAVAVLIKRRLLGDDDWNRFTSLCGQTQPRVKQTELGYLAPPVLRVKGRYMNLDQLIRWSTRMLALLERMLPPQDPAGAMGPLELKYGWVLEFRQQIAQWGEVQRLKELTLQYCRRWGYHAGAGGELAEVLSRQGVDQCNLEFRDKLVALVASQSAGLAEVGPVPASSEILESLIGKGKRMEGQHRAGGFTRMILAMATSLVRLSNSTIIEALGSIREVDLSNWCRDQFGQTLHSLRQEHLGKHAGTKTA